MTGNKVVKAASEKKPDYVQYLKEMNKILNRIAEELAVMNERNISDYTDEWDTEC
jgi:hypothetical protein